MEICGLFELI